MSAPRLVLRIVIATVTVITVGTIAVFGFTQVIEPFAGALGGPPSSLGWDDPGGTTTSMVIAAFLALLLVLIIWFIAAPIRQDKRQQFRR